jgi:hypothetical protein
VVRGITLKGTNLLGDPVDLPLESSSDTYSATDLLPGEYTIEIPAIPFLLNASEPTVIPVLSGAADGDATLIADLGRIRPEYLSIRDWLGSAARENMIVAVSPGESSRLVIFSPSTPATNDPDVDLGTDGDTLTIEGITDTLSTAGDSDVDLRGEVDGVRLYKIDVTGLFAPADGGAEGEAPAALVLGDIQAEGESLAAAAATQSDLFAPTSRMAIGNQTAVLPLSDGDVWVADEGNQSPPGTTIDGQIPVDKALRTVTDLSLDSSVSETIANDSSLDQQLVDQALDHVLQAGL